MSQSDIIIQGIHDLSELQGKRNVILENVKRTNVQAKDIDDVVGKLPSYVDKCSYLKALSEKFINRAAESSSRANDIVELVTEMKRYIESARLETCKNGNVIKQRLLNDLQTIQNASYFIVRPDQRGDYEQYSYTESPIIPQGGKRNRTRRGRLYRKRRNTKRRSH